MNFSKCLLISTSVFFLSITPTLSVQASLYTVLDGQTLEISFEIPNSPNEFIESKLERTDVFQFMIPVTSPVKDRIYPFNSIDSDVTIELYDGSRRLGRKKTRYTNATFTTRDSDYLDGASSLFSPVHVNFESFRNGTIDGLIKVKTDTDGSGYQVNTDNILLNLGISSDASGYYSYWDPKDFITDVEVTGSPTSIGRYAVLLGFESGIKDMKNYLIATGWKKSNIYSYPVEKYSTPDLFNWIRKIKAKAGDEFLLYYHGHGNSDVYGDAGETHKNGTFRVSKGLFLEKYDYAGDESIVYPDHDVTDDDLTNIFKSPTLSGVPWSEIHKTIILDSCFSGGFWGGQDNNDTGDLENVPLTRLIASSGENELTVIAGLDLVDDPKTWLTDNYLKNALLKRKADENGDGTITFAELGAWINKKDVVYFDEQRVLGNPIDYDALYSGTQHARYVTNMPPELENRAFNSVSEDLAVSCQCDWDNNICEVSWDDLAPTYGVSIEFKAEWEVDGWELSAHEELELDDTWVCEEEFCSASGYFFLPDYNPDAEITFEGKVKSFDNNGVTPRNFIKITGACNLPQ